MAYGKIKADTLVYDNSGTDTDVTIASLGNKASLPASAGTVAASEVVQVDANKDTTGIRNLTISGNLQVNGTTTTVASSTMTVTDKNIEIAKGAANDAAADGAGITVESGDGNKTWNWVDATNAWTSSEHIVTAAGKIVLIGTTTEGNVTADNLTIADSGHCGISIRSGTTSDGNIFFSDGTSGDDTLRGYIQYKHNNNSLVLATDATLALTIDSSQNATFAGSVSDSKGDVRSIPQVGSLSANYTLATGDTGKHILTNTKDIIVPNSTFSAGDAITLVNNGSTATTITKNITNLYNPADGSTPTQLAAKGMCTILFVSGTEAYISGAGLS